MWMLDGARKLLGARDDNVECSCVRSGKGTEGREGGRYREGEEMEGFTETETEVRGRERRNRDKKQNI